MQILDCLGSLASNHSATDNKRFLTDLCLAEKHILCCHVSASVFNRISTPAFSQRTIIARIAEDSWSFPVGKEAIQKLPPVRLKRRRIEIIGQNAWNDRCFLSFHCFYACCRHIAQTVSTWLEKMVWITTFSHCVPYR